MSNDKELAEKIFDFLQQEIYTTGEAANVLGVTRRTIYNYIEQGKLQTIKINGRHKISKDQILDFLSSTSDK